MYNYAAPGRPLSSRPGFPDFTSLPIFFQKNQILPFSPFFPKTFYGAPKRPHMSHFSSPLGPTPIYRLPEMKVGLQSDVPKIIPRPYAPYTPITSSCHPLPTPTRPKPHITYDFTFLKKYDII